MSIIPYILPALTVVSLFLYILSAERAWLPKKGTTEWITRAVEPKRMTADNGSAFKVKDFIVFFAVSVVYAGLLILSKLDSFADCIPQIVCTALFAGMIYIAAKLLFKSRAAAFFAAVIAASDALLLETFTADYILLILTAVFAFTALLAAKKPVLFIFAGIFLGFAAFIEPVCILFALPALCAAAVSASERNSGTPVIVWLLCCILLPAAVYCGVNLLAYGSLRFSLSFALPEDIDISTCFCALVFLIIAIVHIFKDKSLPALFVSAGIAVSAVLLFAGVNLMPLFTGLAAAYLTDIIAARGKGVHKAACIVYGVLMLLPVLYSTLYPIISTYIS